MDVADCEPSLADCWLTSTGLAAAAAAKKKAT